jgi:YHS domain-containing protein
MVRKMLVFLIVGIFTLFLSELSFAQGYGVHSSHRQMAQAKPSGHTYTEQDTVTRATTKAAVDVGNRICPVTGEEIEEKNKTTYEYKGKIYNFCCPACIDEFKKDPQKYIKKVKEELEAKSFEPGQESRNR